MQPHSRRKGQDYGRCLSPFLLHLLISPLRGLPHCGALGVAGTIGTLPQCLNHIVQLYCPLCLLPLSPVRVTQDRRVLTPPRNGQNSPPAPDFQFPSMLHPSLPYPQSNSEWPWPPGRAFQACFHSNLVGCAMWGKQRGDRSRKEGPGLQAAPDAGTRPPRAGQGSCGQGSCRSHRADPDFGKGPTQRGQKLIRLFLH